MIDLVEKLRETAGWECGLYDDAAEEIERLRNALIEIKQIVHTPTKDTMFRGAYQHFQSDFDRIRKITKDTLPALILD